MSAKSIIRTIDENNREELKKTYIELSKDNDKVYLDYLFYALKKYIHNPVETLNETTEERLKRQDTIYRKKVIEKYNTCMITGKDIEVCQVAHILPFKDSNEEEKYDSENGFLLSADLHMLFDNKNFDLKINQDGYIIFSDNILNKKSMIEYHQYNNKKLNLTEKNKYYLKKKYEIK